jgi:hypothetical protein
MVPYINAGHWFASLHFCPGKRSSLGVHALFYDLITFALNRTKMKEIVFIVEESQDGGYFARAVNHSIFTQGDTIMELKSMIGDAVHCHFEVTNLPGIIHLQFTH